MKALEYYFAGVDGGKTAACATSFDSLQSRPSDHVAGLSGALVVSVTSIILGKKSIYDQCCIISDYSTLNIMPEI